MSGEQIVGRRPRRKWAWWERFFYWMYGFLIGPFLTKHEDGMVTGAMTRWAVAFFTWAMVVRMLSEPEAPLTWPDAFALFVILFALPIDGAMTHLARRDPKALVQAVTGMFGRGGTRAMTTSTWGRTMTGTDADRAEEIGGPSDDYERPEDLPTDAEPDYEEGDEEPSGLDEEE